MSFYKIVFGLLLSGFIGSLSAQNNSWCVVMRQSNGAQNFDSGSDFPATFVQNQKSKRLFIKDITYNNKDWLVVTGVSKYTDQRYQQDQHFPSEWVEQQWSQGYDITHVAYGSDQWTVIMSKGAGLTSESWGKKSSFEDLKTFIRSKWGDGRSIIDIAYGNGEWVAVLAQGSSMSKQTYNWGTSFPNDWVDQQYKTGKQISSVAYGEGKWVVVMSEYDTPVEESYQVSSKFPKSFIEKGWEEGKRICFAQYNYERDLNDAFSQHFRAGRTLANRGDYDRAVYQYTEALRINPRHAGAYNNRAWAKYQQGQCRGALSDANRALELRTSAGHYHTRAAIYNCMERYHEALTDLHQGLSAASDSEKGELYAERAKARAGLGNTDAAIGDYNLAIQANPRQAQQYEQQRNALQRNAPRVNQPTVTWDYPYDAFASSTNSRYAIKACIHSEAPITSMKLHINGQAFSSRGFGISDDCTASIDQTINLREGSNELVIEVTTAQGSVRSEKRTIEYKANQGGDYHALLIGVENYDDYSINDLNKPIDDCQALAKTLTQEYTFESRNVHMLNNPTKEEILNKLIYLQERLDSDDKLLIFYSGHGIMKNEVGYWLPADADKNRRTKWFSNAELRDYVNSIKTQHTLIIADACFSGSIFTGGYRDVTEFACAEMEKVPSRRAMTSGAHTLVPDNSVFFKYLLKKLQDNNSSCLSAETLYTKIKPAVIYNSPNNHIPQFGVMPQTGDEGGNFIFRRR